MITKLYPFDEGRFADFALEPFPGKLLGGLRIKFLAGKDVYIHLAQKVKGMNSDRAGQNEADRRSAFGVGVRLLLFGENSNVVPEMDDAFLHVN